jgi:mono/diheme cytochrome c family protein
MSLVLAGALAAGAAAQVKVEKTTVTRTSPSSGKEMFTEYCAVCHGAMGKGDGPAASALKKAPADLTQLTAKNGGKFPDIRVMRYISGEDAVAAHGTRDMPMWGEVFHSLNRDQGTTQLRISNLTDYVKGLQAK